MVASSSRAATIPVDVSFCYVRRCADLFRPGRLQSEPRFRIAATGEARPAGRACVHAASSGGSDPLPARFKMSTAPGSEREQPGHAARHFRLPPPPSAMPTAIPEARPAAVRRRRGFSFEAPDRLGARITRGEGDAGSVSPDEVARRRLAPPLQRSDHTEVRGGHVTRRERCPVAVRAVPAESLGATTEDRVGGTELGPASPDLRALRRSSKGAERLRCAGRHLAVGDDRRRQVGPWWSDESRLHEVGRCRPVGPRQQAGGSMRPPAARGACES